MKIVLGILVAMAACQAFAEEQIKMNYSNEELTKIIGSYAKASGQKFIVDPSVKGTVSIFIQEPVGLNEAYNQLSSALALNGYAISKHGDTNVVMSARNTERNLVEVGSQLPNAQPERLFTWVVDLKYVSADDVNRELRILTSRDGELSAFQPRNQLIITDWLSSLYRMSEIIKKIDVDATPEVSKIAATAKAEQEKRRVDRNKKGEAAPKFDAAGKKE